MKRLVTMLLAMMLVAGAAWADVPRLIHYQGRLTNASGTPITTLQTVHFSIWRGGNATTVGGTAEIYREHVALTPNSLGVFEHQIGSGIKDAGDLVPSAFVPEGEYYIQVAVGTTGNVLLPRVRLTSVGFAMVASNAVGEITPVSVSISGVGAVIDSSGKWVGSKDGLGGISGTPGITAISDATGGRLVVGDLVQITGSNLAAAVPLIGGKTAPIKSRSATQIVCQVPAGLPMGFNELAISNQSNVTGASTVVAHLNVHRLLVAITDQNVNNQVHVIDASDNDFPVLRSADPSGTIQDAVAPVQMTFAHEGALALIPMGSGGDLVMIDMTANPPNIQTININSVSTSVGVAVAASGDVGMVADSSTNRVVRISFSDRFPPYAANPLSNAGTILQPNLPNGATARGVTFIGDNMLLVGVGGSFGNGIIPYYRRGGTDFFWDTENEANPQFQSTGGYPIWMEPTADLTQLLMITNNGTNLVNYLVAPSGISTLTNPISLNVGPGCLNVGHASASPTVVASADAAANRVRVYFKNGVQILPAGDLTGPRGETDDTRFPDNIFDDNIDFTVADLDPVGGEIAAAGSDYSRIVMLRVDGGNLVPIGNPVVVPSTSGRRVMALQFQP